jgi:hypothetical protein
MSILGTPISPPVLVPTGSIEASAKDVKPAGIQNPMGLEWSKAKPWLESRLQLVLDNSGKTAERERNQAWKDIQTWKMIGPVEGRAEYGAELNQFVERQSRSEMSVRIRDLGEIHSLTMAVAGDSGQNSATAGINWAKSLSAEDRELYFNAAATPDKFGRYEYRDFDDYIASMSRIEKNWQPQPQANAGAPLTREEEATVARFAVRQASDRQLLAKLTGEFNSRFGGTLSTTDRIELSAEGAKAAAKTLPKEAPADGALDAQLKALETLKQINAQQRDWLKSIEESDKDKADRPDQPELPVQTQNPQPGSRLSVAA